MMMSVFCSTMYALISSSVSWIISRRDGMSILMNWHFKDLPDRKTPHAATEFFIDFEFQSIILEKMIGVVFKKATDKMITAFEKRAAELYN